MSAGRRDPTDMQLPFCAASGASILMDLIEFFQGSLSRKAIPSPCPQASHLLPRCSQAQKSSSASPSLSGMGRILEGTGRGGPRGHSYSSALGQTSRCSLATSPARASVLQCPGSPEFPWHKHSSSGPVGELDSLLVPAAKADPDFMGPEAYMVWKNLP